MFDRLKNWLLGDADHVAEQQLDEMAKKDAFLADALDGYRSVPDGDHARSVAELKARIRQKRKSEPAGFVFTWTRIAAAAALISAVSIFIWLQQSTTPDGPIVENTPTETIQAPPVLRADKTEEKIEQEELAFKNEPITKYNETAETFDFNTKLEITPPAEVNPENIEAGIMDDSDLIVEDDQIVAAEKIDEAYESVPATTDPKVITNVEQPTLNNAGSKDEIAFSVPPAPMELAEEEAEILGEDVGPAKEFDIVTSQRAEAEVLNKVSGLVVDIQSGEPVIGANVFIKDSEIGTVTDMDGMFTLESPKELPWEVVTNYVGHSNEVLTIDDAEQQLVVNMETNDALLDEVTVTGYAEKKKKRGKARKTEAKPADPSGASAPEPIMGFKKMKLYIRKNLDYPQTARLNQIQGTVTVRFFIDEDGRPQNLTVMHGLGAGCDQEAMRLIREGPKWKPSKVWAVYTVVFNL